MKNDKKVNTSGPTVSGMFSPNRDNLLDPITDTAMDFERCVQCGYCRSVCRVYNATYNEMDYAGGRMRILKSLARKEIKFDKDGIIDSIFRCMLCGNCAEVCPVEIDTVAVFQKFRKDAIKIGVLPKRLGQMNDAIMEKKNPFMEDESRFRWVKDCPEGKRALERGEELFKQIRSGDPSSVVPRKVAYFIGCTAGYRNTELAIASSKILEKLGIDFIMMPEEQCCGSVLYRTGLEDNTIGLIHHNTDLIRESGVTDVVFSCSGCYSTLALEYPRILKEELGFNLYHLVEYIPMMLKEKGLKVKHPKYTKENPLVVTYHDPCHLGRYMKKYDEPRELLAMMEGIKLVEMKHIKEMSHCCGAGGGVKALYGDIAGDIARDRLDETQRCVIQLRSDRMKEAEETDADYMVSACVFCKNNLSQAAKEDEAALEVMDIIEILQHYTFYK